jgi:cyclopropane fatty-acyl-phospholipid synthase-like methyltransferase
MKIAERSWNEFWAYYWRVTERRTIPAIAEYDHKVVSLVEAQCHLSPTKRILDLGCGGGDQARIFAEKGYVVTGIDIAPSLIRHAKEKIGSNQNRTTFLVSDMRNIDYQNDFDVCTLLSGTFGFFSEEENQSLLNKISIALTANGYIFIMYVSAHRTDLNKRSWKRIDNGYQLTEQWFDAEASTYHSTVKLISDDGEMIIPKNEEGYHANESIRCYTPMEIGKMLMKAGFANIVHLARKHLDDPNALLEPWDIREIAVGQKKSSG